MVLLNAVILSWMDFMPDTSTSLVRVEYRLGPDGRMEYLQVWSSTKRAMSILCATGRALGRRLGAAVVRSPGGPQKQLYAPRQLTASYLTMARNNENGEKH